MIQLSQTQVATEPDAIPKLAEEFAATGIALLPGFLTPPILKPLLTWLETARFEAKDEVARGRVFGTTLFMPETEPTLFLLHFILNRPPLFRVLEQVADCPRLGNFLGRLHRTAAEPNQQIDWHDDAIEGRTLGISINLSTEPYTGGVLQVRDPNRRLCGEVGRAAPGDAFLFRIGHGWQHRLTPVESGRRTVGVGWFRTGQDWREYALNATRSTEILAGSRPESQPPPSGVQGD